MLLRQLTREELAGFYRRNMARSFPPDELKPLRAMEQIMAAGAYRVLGLTDGHEIAGIATAYRVEPGWRLFDYLCVAPERRDQGLGGQLVAGLVAAERGSILFGESELPDFAPDPDTARRRLDFYRRCGAREAGYNMTLFGVPYQVLYWADHPVAADEIAARHALAYGQRFSKRIYERFVTIPWSAADGVPNPVDWTECEEDEEK